MSVPSVPSSLPDRLEGVPPIDDGAADSVANVLTIERKLIPEEFRDAVHRTDHTALGQSVTAKDIISLCREAASSDPYPNSVCVQGKWVSLASDTLKQLGCHDRIEVCAVGDRQFPNEPLSPIIIEDRNTPSKFDETNFPGISSLSDKLADVEEAVRNGATIFDMVLNTKYIYKGGRLVDNAIDEIITIRSRLPHHIPLRVICSTGLLRLLKGHDSLVDLFQKIAKSSLRELPKGALVMKTETGFVVNPHTGGKFGATVEDITLMRRLLPENISIKASGGINRDNANTFINAGADFLGASGFLRDFVGKGGTDSGY